MKMDTDALLSPYVRLYVEHTGLRRTYHLEVAFRLPKSCLTQTPVMTKISDRKTKVKFAADYSVLFTLDSSESMELTETSPAVFTTVVLKNVPLSGIGRIAVMGQWNTPNLATNGDNVSYGPQGDGKTIIRFQDAVRR